MKEGLALEFATLMFQTWISEKSIAHIGSALRKAQLEKRLLVRNTTVVYTVHLLW